MSDTPQDRSEAARVRRRWLNLGELLAIAAVAISALTLWNSYSERTNSEAAAQADAAKSSRVAAILVLKAEPTREGRSLTLTPRSDSQVIQSQTITFPSLLGLDPVSTTGDPRIERDWFDSALVKARKAAGAKHDQPGDARMPVLIATTFLVDGEPRTETALFELGYEAQHAFLSGTTIKLKGLSRLQPVKDAATGKRTLDTLMKARLG
jgi:hypothetical protein